MKIENIVFISGFDFFVLLKYCSIHIQCCAIIENYFTNEIAIIMWFFFLLIFVQSIIICNRLRKNCKQLFFLFQLRIIKTNSLQKNRLFFKSILNDGYQLYYSFM